MLTMMVTLSAENPYKVYTQGLPFEMPEVNAPQIPDRQVLLSDYDADGTGQRLCTDAFARAITALTAKGGGRLVVPSGIWLTGPIVLKSNIELHLEHGAVIQFAADESLYPIVQTSFEGLDTRRCQSPISAVGQTNIAITGDGAIDGNGQYWRPLKKSKVTENQWKTLTSQPGGVMKRKDYWVPSQGYDEAEQMSSMNVPDKELSDEQWQHIKRFLRPVMVSLVGCKNVLLQGVIFQNSPAWNLHPLMCENIIIDGVTARNPFYAQNGDALDLESCRNALIVNSTFDAGDDCICVKSGKDEEGRKRGRACENVVISGCTVFAGHGGFTVGSEMSGGVKNVLIRDCQFLGTDVGIRFKSTRGRGGVVENIFIDGISMYNIIEDAITFDLYYGGKSVTDDMDGIEQQSADARIVADETTPCFRDITIQNIICRGASRALYFNGLPEQPIKNVTLRNIHITADKEGEFKYCENVKKENVIIEQ